MFASVDWQAVDQTDWYSRRLLTEDVKSMCANPQSNRLNTIAVRASYILPIEAISLKSKKNRGGGLSPSGKTKAETSLFF